MPDVPGPIPLGEYPDLSGLCGTVLDGGRLCAEPAGHAGDHAPRPYTPAPPAAATRWGRVEGR
jgi:hypothetical protein